jgi:DNA polymerase-3 subunit beta
MSKEETRYYLNGFVLDCAADGSTVAVATDGHRLRLQPAPALQPIGAILKGARPIVPRALGAIWRNASVGKAATLRLYRGGKTYIAIEMDDLRIVGKAIDGTFPAWPKVVPTVEAATLRTPRAGLLMALQRLSAIATEKSVSVRVALTGTRMTPAAAQLAEALGKPKKRAQVRQRRPRWWTNALRQQGRSPPLV